MSAIFYNRPSNRVKCTNHIAFGESNFRVLLQYKDTVFFLVLEFLLLQNLKVDDHKRFYIKYVLCKQLYNNTVRCDSPNSVLVTFLSGKSPNLKPLFLLWKNRGPWWTAMDFVIPRSNVVNDDRPEWSPHAIAVSAGRAMDGDGPRKTAEHDWSNTLRQ